MSENRELIVAEGAGVEVTETPEDIYAGLSLSVLSDEQAAILTAPVDPLTEVDILPTGEVYLGQIQYRRRLTKAFGPGGWALRPLSKPAVRGNLLMQEWALYAQGRFISSAYGEMQYIEGNDRMTYGDVIEGAKSNALMRCAKDLGMATECWDRRFIQKFQDEHCVQVWRGGDGKSKSKPQWRRKEATPWWDEKGSVQPKQGGGQASPPAQIATKPSPQQPVSKDAHGTLVIEVGKADDDGFFGEEDASVAPTPAEGSPEPETKVAEVPAAPKEYDTGKLHYRDMADPNKPGETLTQVNFAGAAWRDSKKQISPEVGKSLMALFKNEFEARNHVKKHFEGNTTLFTLTYEEAAALYRWKKEGVADPRWYADKIAVAEPSPTSPIWAEIVSVGGIEKYAGATYFAHEFDAEDRERFVMALSKMADPSILTQLYQRGWDTETNRSDFIVLAELLAEGQMKWGDSECEAAIASVKVAEK